MECLHRAGFDRDEHRGAAGLRHGVPRLGELGLFDTLAGYQERDGPSVQRHPYLPQPTIDQSSKYQARPVPRRFRRSAAAGERPA
jgi:hypothetical protein